jgi:hypothetical protein
MSKHPRPRRIYPYQSFPSLEFIPDLQDIILTLSPQDYPISSAARILSCPVLYERTYQSFSLPEHRYICSSDLLGDIKEDLKFLFLSFLATAPPDYLLDFLSAISTPGGHLAAKHPSFPLA